MFCPKCGSPIAEGVKFCAKCGAPASGVAAPSASQPASPVAAAPAATAKSGSALKIVLIIVGVFMFFVISGFATCIYIGYRAKQKLQHWSAQVQASYPQSATNNNSATGAPNASSAPSASPGAAGAALNGATADVPVYPNATPTKNSSEMSFGTEKMATQEFTTPDSVDQVVAFYKAKLSNNVTFYESNGKAEFILNANGAETTIGIAPTPNASGTTLTISRIGK